MDPESLARFIEAMQDVGFAFEAGRLTGDEYNLELGVLIDAIYRKGEYESYNRGYKNGLEFGQLGGHCDHAEND